MNEPIHNLLGKKVLRNDLNYEFFNLPELLGFHKLISPSE